MEIFVSINGQENGPYTIEEVRQYLATGQLKPEMPAWREGMAEWQPLSTFTEFKKSGRGAKPGKAKNSRMPIFIGAAAVLVVLAAGVAWALLREHGTGSGTGNKTASEPATTPSAGAPADDPNLPQSLADLNTFYKEPPPDQNAAAFFLKGFAAMQILPTDGKSPNLPIFGQAKLPAPGSPLPSAMRNAVSALMQRNMSAWELLQRGRACSQCRYPLDYTKGNDLDLPHLPKLKQAALLAELYAIGYTQTGKGKEAVDSVLVIYALGGSVEAEPGQISQLVRIGCEAIGKDALQHVVNGVALSPDSLPGLQEMLHKKVEQEAAGIPFTCGILGERVLGLANFDLPPEKLLSNPAFSAGGAEKSAELTKLITKNAKADRQFMRETFDQILQARKEPLPARLKADEIMARRASEAKSKQFPISSLALPALGFEKEARGVATIKIAETAVALERYRAGNSNHYPETLADLAPRFLAGTPEDPFDGQPLRYAKADRGYTLRSIGPAAKPAANAKGATAAKEIVFTVVNPPVAKTLTP